MRTLYWKIRVEDNQFFFLLSGVDILFAGLKKAVLYRVHTHVCNALHRQIH